MTPPSLTPLSASNPSHIASTCATYNLTTDEFHALHRRAVDAKALAYAPYSRFRVGAALLPAYGGPDGLVVGANVENASYPVGTCAERVALGRAVVDGHRSFRAVAVAADTDAPCSPCGMCRQFIREFCELDLPILMFDKKGGFIVTRLETLLPLSFGPDALKTGISPA